MGGDTHFTGERSASHRRLRWICHGACGFLVTLAGIDCRRERIDEEETGLVDGSVGFSEERQDQGLVGLDDPQTREADDREDPN